MTAAIFNADHRDNLNFLFTPPAARVNNTGDQSIPNNTATTLTFNNSHYDLSAMFNGSSALSCLTGLGGNYTIGACAQWAGNATGSRQLYLRLNGSVVLAMVEQDPGSTSPLVQQVGTQYVLAAGDYLEVVAFQNSGGGLNVTAVGNYSPEFWMAR
jgi:hypothetical protein